MGSFVLKRFHVLMGNLDKNFLSFSFFTSKRGIEIFVIFKANVFSFCVIFSGINREAVTSIWSILLFLVFPRWEFMLFLLFSISIRPLLDESAMRLNILVERSVFLGELLESLLTNLLQYRRLSTVVPVVFIISSFLSVVRNLFFFSSVTECGLLIKSIKNV